MTIEIRNAIINSATITNNDHGLLSAWLHLDYGGTGQGFGGYALYSPKQFYDHGGPNYAGHFISRCMEVADVSSWENLPGKTIRVKCCSRSIMSIGHITKDDWFCPAEDFRLMKGEDQMECEQ